MQLMWMTQFNLIPRTFKTSSLVGPGREVMATDASLKAEILRWLVNQEQQVKTATLSTRIHSASMQAIERVTAINHSGGASARNAADEIASVELCILVYNRRTML